METDKNIDPLETEIQDAASPDFTIEDSPSTDADDGKNDNLTRKERNKKKDKEGAHKTLIRVIVSIIIIAVGIFLILFFVAKAAKYESIGAMLERMSTELSLMWQRINS